jgi:hypothetical protein
VERGWSADRILADQSVAVHLHTQRQVLSLVAFGQLLLYIIRELLPAESRNDANSPTFRDEYEWLSLRGRGVKG